MGITANDSDAAIVRAIIELAHQLGIKVIAEGIENQATWDLLVELGCDAGQGYFVSRPLPAPDMVHWLSTWEPAGEGKAQLVVPSLRVARISAPAHAARGGRVLQRATRGS
jgi:predicted signal transduction protein with EAL and GGDEF domain